MLRLNGFTVLMKYLNLCLLSHCNVIGPVRIPLAYGEIASLN